MATVKGLRFELIPFEQWRKEIAPLWSKEQTHQSIYTFLNGFGQIQYSGGELFTRIVVFPIAAEFEGRRVGWTSVYNISGTAVRIRGIYVLPEFRHRGIGYALTQHAMELWPEPWHRCFMYARESTVRRYTERWGFQICSGHRLRSLPQDSLVGEERMILVQKDFRPAPRGMQSSQAAPVSSD